MTGDCHVRFCESLRVKLPRTTHLLSERYDMSEPEVHRDVASALCDVLRQMSRITGKGATEFLTMYQMTLNGSDKQV